MRYEVMESTDLADLSRQVNEYLRQGWVAQGGVAVYAVKPRDEVPAYYMYVQAVSTPE